MTEKRNLCLAIAGILLTASSMLVEAQQCVNRPNIMFCGSSSRTGTSLYSGVGPFTEVSGCTPDANTQALLVSRSGTVAGNGAAWLAYLNAGGRIITEYSSSDNVYNEIYGTAYAQPGSQNGDCYDQAMPSLKLNPSDPFWLANNLTPTPDGTTSCGFDLSAIVTGEGANVTALGGLVNTSEVTFVRRVQGSGTLFLLDADWQDTNLAFSNDSLLFMGALLSACGVAPPQQSVTAVPVDDPLALIGLGSLIALLGAGYARRRASKP